MDRWMDCEKSDRSDMSEAIISILEGFKDYPNF